MERVAERGGTARGGWGAECQNLANSSTSVCIMFVNFLQLVGFYS